MTILSELIRDQMEECQKHPGGYPITTNVTRAEFAALTKEMRKIGLFDEDVEPTHLRRSVLVIVPFERF